MALPIEAKKPDWLRVRAPSGEKYQDLKSRLRERTLYTVCEEARCPNLGECWAVGTATIMVMGDTCTRGCRFCNVKTGNPRGVLDAGEPEKVANSVREMGFEYVVITTVDRDDLADQGAAHFAKVVSATKQLNPNVLIETLAGDFRGEISFTEELVRAGVDVYSHNIETVQRLTPKVRDRRASYEQSLRVLAGIKRSFPNLVTKTSLMVGLGETFAEVLETMRDARAAGCEIFTIGQYLRPTRRHLAVERFVTPDEFKKFEQEGLAMGFAFVASGPLVRSSYRAGEFFLKSYLADRRNRGISPLQMAEVR